MNEVYLLIGGNMGDREGYITKAKTAIEKHCGNIINQSAIYETEPWGITDQASFLNQALCLSSILSAEQLLDRILEIEEDLGRKRHIKYGPRIIDIDILLYNDAVINIHHLKIPHPEMQNRRFALQCLQDIAKEKLHPILKKTIAQLLTECPDPLTVHKFS